MPKSRTELWTSFVNRPFAEFDQTVEMADSNGFDGLWVCDSQNIMPEAWVLLSRAAVLSSRLKLGTFVTNAMTRHAAVTAAAAATLQDASRGRVIMSIGKGDSSLANLGSGPVTLSHFSRYIDRVQAYLRGEDVPFDPADTDNPNAASLASLQYAHVPTASRINWLPSDQPKVPLDVSTSGPKVMAMAAAKADGITLGVGVDPVIIRDAMERVRDHCIAAGRDPSEVKVSGLLSLVVHPDRQTALEIAAGSAASIARWQLIQGSGKSQMSQKDYAELDRARKAYDMTRHAETGTSHAAAIGEEMIDRFAIAGPPDHCIARLRELMDLGLARLSVPYMLGGVDEATQKLSTELLLKEVLPALRA